MVISPSIPSRGPPQVIHFIIDPAAMFAWISMDFHRVWILRVSYSPCLGKRCRVAGARPPKHRVSPIPWWFWWKTDLQEIAQSHRIHGTGIFSNTMSPHNPCFWPTQNRGICHKNMKTCRFWGPW